MLRTWIQIGIKTVVQRKGVFPFSCHCMHPCNIFDHNVCRQENVKRRSTLAVLQDTRQSLTDTAFTFKVLLIIVFATVIFLLPPQAVLMAANITCIDSSTWYSTLQRVLQSPILIYFKGHWQTWSGDSSKLLYHVSFYLFLGSSLSAIRGNRRCMYHYTIVLISPKTRGPHFSTDLPQ